MIVFGRKILKHVSGRFPMNRRCIKTVIVLSSTILFSSLCRSDDKNPLNLPMPLDPARPGAVMLHGGQWGELGEPIFQKFVELAGGKNAKIVLIPSGYFVQGIRGVGGREFKESRAQFEARIANAFGGWIDEEHDGTIARFRFLYTDNRTDADDPEFVKRLDDVSGVWIPGAYQGKLAWRFTHAYPDGDDKSESLFQQALRNVVARGGVVCGVGGGMAALPELMIMGDTGQANGPAVAELYPGLKLFTGAIVDQNFDALGGRLERFTGLLKDTATLDKRITWPAVGRNMIGLAVEQETALVVRGAVVEAVGDRKAHLFLKGNGDRTIRWRMLSQADGPVSLVASSSQSPTAAARVDSRARVDPSRKNPFGLPEPFPGARPGMVVLHGGGENLDLIDVFPSFAGVPHPKLVHCPAASESFRPAPGRTAESVLPEIRDYFFEWIDMQRSGRLADVRFITTSDPADADRAEFCRSVSEADAVWFSGGDQNELAKLFVGRDGETLFQRELKRVVGRGGVVGGSSAGTAVMANIMITAGEPVNGLPAKAEFGRGFGVLRNCIVEQHFQGDGRGGRIERFTRLLLDRDGELQASLGTDGPRVADMIGLAIEERTALLLQENRLRVFGAQNAHVFLKSSDGKTVTWHALKPGDAAFVYYGPDAAPCLNSTNGAYGNVGDRPETGRRRVVCAGLALAADEAEDGVARFRSRRIDGRENLHRPVGLQQEQRPHGVAVLGAVVFVIEFLGQLRLAELRITARQFAQRVERQIGGEQRSAAVLGGDGLVLAFLGAGDRQLKHALSSEIFGVVTTGQGVHFVVGCNGQHPAQSGVVDFLARDRSQCAAVEAGQPGHATVADVSPVGVDEQHGATFFV